MVHMEVVGRGYRIRVPRRKPTRRIKPRARDRHHSDVNRAKLRAAKRLRAIFPDLYDALLAEERAAAGLDPWPLDMAVRYAWDPDSSVSMRFAEIYHALDRGAQ